jgi:hypothetical protein
MKRTSRLGGWRAPLGLLVTCGALSLAACSGATTAPARPRLAIFGFETKQYRADPKLVRRLEALVPRLVEELDFRPVAADELRDHLPKRRGRARPCVEPPCQVKVGRELGATASLSLRIEQNLLQECDVYAALYELQKSGADQRSRARASCGSAELKDSVGRAVCRVLVAGTGTAAEQEARHRECLSAAELLWLDQEVEAFGDRPIKGSPEQMMKEERQMAEQALALRRRFQSFQRTAPSTAWSLAAECGAGGIYEAFARALTRSGETLEVPRPLQKQGEEAAQSFRTQMIRGIEDRARPLRDQAAQLYRACLKHATELKLSTRHTDAARRRLGELERRAPAPAPPPAK